MLRNPAPARESGLMKPPAIVISTALGKVVDEVALARAITDCRIHAAGLDAFT
jgi:lactate dehydrogenase-like 2-hydroxyacid dehydrogenase